MVNLERFCLVVAIAVCSLGCDSEVIDTEERRFEVSCEGEDCRLVQMTPAEDSGNGADPDETTGGEFFVRDDGRVLAVCPGDGGHAPAYKCRPLACETSGVCGKLGGAGFACVAGLCQDESREVTSDDREVLCQVGTGPWSETREQRERLTLSRGCRKPCVVPAACREP